MEKDYVCPSCGSKFIYNPKIKALQCVNCGAIEHIKVMRAKERPFEEAMSKKVKNDWSKAAKSVRCDRCGAVEILNKGDLSDVCPFCGHTTVIDIDNEEMLAPTAIMPFTITTQEAKFAIASKIKKGFWVPKSLKKKLKINTPKGIYTPVYSFDADVKCAYKGTLFRIETHRRRTADGEWETYETEESFYVSGTTQMRVDDLLIDAGQVINSVILKKIEPFDSNNSVEYNDKFLYGYAANQSSKNIDIAFKQAKDSFRVMLERKIVNLHNASRAGDLDINMFIDNLTYKYILLPVYSEGFTYKNKTYTLYCNGTTSKVAGRLPVSGGKVWSVVLGVLAVIGIITGIVLICV